MNILIEKYGNSGIYVDLGCSEERSMTKQLEDAGWKGLHIDARLNYAVYSHNGFVDFYDLKEVSPALKFFSGVKYKLNESEIQKHLPAVDVLANLETKKVECKTLETILDENNLKNISFLKVDIEGSEREVFRVFPFDKFNIDYILIEGFYCNDILISNGFKFIECINDRDYLYEHIHS